MADTQTDLAKQVYSHAGTGPAPDGASLTLYTSNGPVAATMQSGFATPNTTPSK